MAEGVAGLGAWDGERELVRSLRLGYDDPRVAGVPIPFERDRESTVSARVEFHKHDWLLAGFWRLTSRAGRRHLTAPTVRFPVRGRARVCLGAPRGWDDGSTESRHRDPSGARPGPHAGR